jgi:cell division GTPase FtsZ
VVDTSDVFNAIRKKGLAVLGMSRQKLPHHLIRRIVYRKESELKAIRTKRMVDMVDESLSSLSVDCDVTTARGALLVFSGEPEEITMDGLFACISRIERVNPEIEIRYGDYPVPGSNSIASIVIFSGITRLVV